LYIIGHIPALHFGGHREERKQWRPHLDDIESLSRSTGYTPSELRTLYRGFKQVAFIVLKLYAYGNRNRKIIKIVKPKLYALLT